jgi:PAS domain-containing protein
MDDPRPESPVLLLVPSTQAGTLAPTVWTKIDEVVEIPVRWPEMNNRIQVLLRMQEHAREGDRFRELAAKYKVMLETQQNRLSGYKSLFQNGACGALVIQELEVVEANSQAEQLFGGDDLVGTPFASLLPSPSPEGPGPPDTARALTDLRSQEKRRTEQEFVRPNGETFKSPITLRSLQFEGDTAVQILFSTEDNDTPKRRPIQARPE